MSMHYFLSANLLLAGGYLLYKLMGNDTFFTVRRLFLLCIPLFALTVEPLASTHAISALSASVNVSQTFIDNLVINNQANELRTFDMETTFWTVYVSISIILFLRLLFQFYRISQMVRRSSLRNLENIKYRVLGQNESGAFSFFNHIFIGEELEKSPQLQYILLHEQAHSRELHSLDVVWMQLVKALFWINPFVSLINRELRILHEYLADRAVRSAITDVKGYQLALLHQTSTSAAALPNNFNVSSLKKRFIMLNRQPTSRKWSAKFLVLLPTALTAILCFSWAKASNQTSNTAMQSAAPVEQHESTQTKHATVDKLATYPGGETALMQDLAKIIRFPAKAMEDKVNGMCFITFTVQTDGSVSNPKVKKSLTPECDKEALRAIMQLKKFQPAMKDGNPVASEYAIPIRFRIK